MDWVIQNSTKNLGSQLNNNQFYLGGKHIPRQTADKISAWRLRSTACSCSGPRACARHYTVQCAKRRLRPSPRIHNERRKVRNGRRWRKLCNSQNVRIERCLFLLCVRCVRCFGWKSRFRWQHARRCCVFPGRFWRLRQIAHRLIVYVTRRVTYTTYSHCY